MATIEELERVHELLEDCKKNYKGIGVIESLLNEISQSLPRQRAPLASRSPTEEQPYGDELMSILPYSLWPSML